MKQILQVSPQVHTGAGLLITTLLRDETNNIHSIITSDDLLEDNPSNRSLNTLSLNNRMYKIDVFHRDKPNYYKIFPKLCKIFSYINPDIVHSHNGYTALLSSRVIKHLKLKAKHISTFHSFGISRPFWMTKQDIRGFNSVDIMTTVCSFNTKILYNLGLSKPCIISPVYTKPISIYSHPYTFKDSVFLSVCSIEPRKNLLDLIKIFHLLNTIYNMNLKLYIIGKVIDTNYYTTLLKYIYEQKAYNIVFTGYEHNPENYYKNATFYISTSISEGFGISILDAMSYGCIPIVNRVEGLLDFTDDKNSININLTNLDETVYNIYNIMTNKLQIENLQLQGMLTALKYPKENFLKFWTNMYE